MTNSFNVKIEEYLKNHFNHIILFQWFIISFLTVIYYVQNEIYTQRYPGIFVAYIDLINNDKIKLDLDILSHFFTPDKFYYNYSNMINNLIETESYFKGVTSLYLIVLKITSLKTNQLLLIPFGVFLIPLGYLILIKKISKTINNDLISSLLIFDYILIYFSLTKLYSSFYIASVSYFFILCILNLMIDYLLNHNKKHIILFIIVLFSLTLYWHTAKIMIGFIIYTLFITHIIFNYKNLNKLYINNFLYFIIIDIFITILFTNLWQSDYLTSYISTFNILDFLSKILYRFSIQPNVTNLFIYDYKYNFLGRLYYFSLLIIYLISFIFSLLTLFKGFTFIKNNNYKTIFSIFISLIISQMLITVIYYKASDISLLFLVYYLPIFTIPLLFTKQMKEYERNFKLFLLILLCFFSLVARSSSLMTNELGQTSLTKFEDAKSSFYWIYNYYDDQEIILDFNILGKYIQLESHKDLKL